MYKTLDQWFSPPGVEIKTQKTIFYFDYETMTSSWLFKKPKEVKYTTIVKWNKVPIMLCTNLPQDHKYEIPKDKKYNVKQISYFKSNLQKCIRRQLNEKAVKTAYHMIKLDISEFLRRLTVIILEDVKFHKSYSTLVWLMSVMLSTKEVFKPNKQIIDWLLGVVNTLCNITEYDKVDYENDKNKYKDNITDFNDYDLLYTLLYRTSYGGMYYDINMLNYFVGLWFKRFENDEKCNQAEVELVDSSKVKSLTMEDWKLDGENMAGVDFHCAPYILEILSKEYGYSEKELKRSIWDCSSGINYRKPTEETVKDIEIWNKIRDKYFELQHGIFNKYLKGF